MRGEGTKQLLTDSRVVLDVKSCVEGVQSVSKGGGDCVGTVSVVTL